MEELVFFQDVALHRARADTLFAQVQAQLRALLPRAVVLHVGSTSLPDGLTKGDLDVQVRVKSEDFQEACDVVSSLYEENPGGFTDQGRSFKTDASDPPLGVHVTVIDGPSDIQHRQRDLLAARPDLRAAYDAMKRTFEGKEMGAYRAAKARFFDHLLTSTGANGVRIRPYEPRDMEQAVEVWFTSWAATFPSLQHPWPLEQWRSRFKDKLEEGARIFIAEDSEGALVLGFVLLFENVGRLDQLFVRPGKQGQGVGTALLLLAKRRCPSGLHLDTLLANEGARRFYERHGFTAGRTGVNTVNGQPKVEYTWTPKRPLV